MRRRAANPTFVACLALFAALLSSGCLNAATLDPNKAASSQGFSSVTFAPGAYITTGDFSRVLDAGTIGISPLQVLTIPSRIDQAVIQIGLVLPIVPVGTQVPVIAIASPYLGDIRANVDGHPQAVLATNVHFLIDNFVPHGYAVAFIPVRGTSGSGGCVEWFGPNEASDLNQAIDWLATQPWSSGNVGMIGLSWEGTTPWEVAATGNPHLKTIVPNDGITDLYSAGFHNGSAVLGAPALTSQWYATYGLEPQHGRSPQDAARTLDCPEHAKSMAALAGGYAQPSRDDPSGYFAPRDFRARVAANYHGSIFLVHGLQDWRVYPHVVFPWIDTLRSNGIVVKELIGQWEHQIPDSDVNVVTSAGNPTSRMDWAETLLHWFDRWLKNDATADLGPAVEVADSSNAWRTEKTWPPQDAAITRFYLTASGALDTTTASARGEKMIGADGARVLLTDSPAPCVACATFDSAPLAQGLRFAGLPTFHVTVIPSAPVGQVTARLDAVNAAGEATRLGWTLMDIRYAAGGESADTVVPGQPLVLKMELEPLDAVVAAGSHLRLTISQAGYGNDQAIYHISPYVVPLRIEVGGDQSVLTVGAFHRDLADIFVPPHRAR